MRTYFNNIPDDQKKAMRVRARESLVHWKANAVIDPSKLIQSRSFYLYPFGGYHYSRTQGGADVYLKINKGTPLQNIEFKYTKGAKEVIFDVTKEHWVRKLILKVITKQETKIAS